ncbi:MAG: hypothetical protein IH991_19705, partial [Planctomycetes bacterium]|nr:hypothetical protein [Planctomycetota bacterium]
RVTAEELQRVRDDLEKITKKYYETSERELESLDRETRRTLKPVQLQAIKSLIGDRKVLEGPFLDFAILRLETVTDRIDVGLKESAAVLGRSTKYELAITGHLQPAKNDSPVHFFAAFRNGINRAGLTLDVDQRDFLADHEKRLMSEVSGKSNQLYQQVIEGKLTVDEAKKTLTHLAKSEISRTVLLFDALLSHKQKDQLDEYVLRRDLLQRGMLPILVEGRRITISEKQKKALVAIVERKLKRFRELTRQTEAEIWRAIKNNLAPERRKLWTEAYGDGTRESLPVSPVLLLFRPKRSAG